MTHSAYKPQHAERRHSYLEYCEWMWSAWLDGSLPLSPFLRSRFEVEAAPEPWLPFSPGARPLFVLTTNPGAVLDIQRKRTVIDGHSLIAKTASYRQVATAFADYYATSLSGAARVRIGALQRLAALSGHDGFIQVECCPFHSESLPNKTALTRQLGLDPLLLGYSTRLAAYLKGKTVVAVSAVSSRHSLGPNAPQPQLSPWLHWQAKLLGLQSPSVVPLVWKESRVTAAALVGERDATRSALVLMMGGNHLPATAGLLRLAESLRPE